MGGDDFAKLATAVPGIDGLISAAPEGGPGRSGLGKVLFGLPGGFSKLGMNGGMIGKFVPVIPRRSRPRMRLLLLAILVLALALPVPGCDGESAGEPGGDAVTVSVARVIDGDTIVIEGGDRVRYIGVDAPEMPDEYLASEATEENSELVEGRVVRLEKDVRDEDDYGRLLRYVWVDGTMVNAELVRLGYAWSHSYPPDTRHQDMLDHMEDEARRNGLGVWASSR